MGKGAAPHRGEERGAECVDQLPLVLGAAARHDAQQVLVALLLAQLRELLGALAQQLKGGLRKLEPAAAATALAIAAAGRLQHAPQLRLEVLGVRGRAAHGSLRAAAARQRRRAARAEQRQAGPHLARHR
jgi:hypothetical protein